MTKLKLFVWTEFAPDYLDGLAFAIAETEKEARELVIEAYGVDAYNWGRFEVKDLKEPCGYAVGGSS